MPEFVRRGVGTLWASVMFFVFLFFIKSKEGRYGHIDFSFELFEESIHLSLVAGLTLISIHAATYCMFGRRRIEATYHTLVSLFVFGAYGSTWATFDEVAPSIVLVAGVVGAAVGFSLSRISFLTSSHNPTLQEQSG